MNAPSAFVNEGTTSFHTLSITGQTGLPVTPESLKYRVTGGCGVEIIAWTTVDTSTTEIEIPGPSNVALSIENRISYLNNTGVPRYLTIEATHDGGRVITSEYEYMVVDLNGI